jgi:hypothetical protein
MNSSMYRKVLIVVARENRLVFQQTMTLTGHFSRYRCWQNSSIAWKPSRPNITVPDLASSSN